MSENTFIPQAQTDLTNDTCVIRVYADSLQEALDYSTIVKLQYENECGGKEYNRAKVIMNVGKRYLFVYKSE